MKTIKRIALFLAASAALATAADTANKAPGVSYTDKKFYFAAWGVPRGSGETQLAGMKALADAGITDILPENKTAAQLMVLVDLGSQVGIRIHAWHWMMNVGNAAECRQHPDWYSVNRLGQSCFDFHPYVSYYSFLSPFSPGARDYIKKGVKEVAQVKGLASVHFDYIRFVDVVLGAQLQTRYRDTNGLPLVQDRLLPDYDFDYHPLARQEFKEKFGVDPMDMPDKVENAAWKQFRMDAISSLVNESVQICHENGTLASAAVFPFPELAREYVKQDWPHWDLDLVFPMDYKNDHNGNLYWVGFATKQAARDLKPGQHLFTGLSVGNYGNNMADFEEAIHLAHDNGAIGVSFFNLNSLRDAQLAVIKKCNAAYNK